MAAAVAAVIEHGGTLIAEAGTGTGKTLAYLIPAILSGQRVLVSTGTKNLQEQIFFKDIPLLREALGKPFSATLMKGRSNYLCLHRFETYRDGVEGNTSAGGRLIESGDRVVLPIINAWVKNTETGDRAELRDLPEDLPLWKDIAADAETCLGNECPRYGDCFVTLMRQRAAESDVVIVNHHLLCADAQLRKSDYGEVIPASATLVIDEAHQLEDVATQYFGIAVSNYRVDDLMRDVESAVSLTPEMLQATSRVADRARTFFSGMAMARMDVAESKARYNSDTFVDYFQDGAMLAGALEGLEATLVLSLKKDEPDEVVASLARRARELRRDLTFLIRANDTDFVYYVESRARGLFLRAAPIDVSRLAKEALFDRMRTTVLTSATLAVDGSFEYVKSRLGIRDAMELRVESEFDYARQALLYLATPRAAAKVARPSAQPPRVR
jgi:ATP-dependent DNA helicase DinG